MCAKSMGIVILFYKHSEIRKVSTKSLDSDEDIHAVLNNVCSISTWLFLSDGNLLAHFGSSLMLQLLNNQVIFPGSLSMAWTQQTLRT